MRPLPTSLPTDIPPPGIRLPGGPPPPPLHGHPPPGASAVASIMSTLANSPLGGGGAGVTRPPPPLPAKALQEMQQISNILNAQVRLYF